MEGLEDICCWGILGLAGLAIIIYGIDFAISHYPLQFFIAILIILSVILLSIEGTRKFIFGIPVRHKLRSEYKIISRKIYDLLYELRKVENDISQLKEKKEKYEEPLSRLENLKKELKHIISSDIANLSIVADKIRLKTQSCNHQELKGTLLKTDRELENIEKEKNFIIKNIDELKVKIDGLNSKVEKNQSRLEDINKLDPANVQIRIKTLQKKWESLDETDLKKEKADGEIAEIIKENIISKYTIKRKNTDIKDLQHRLEKSSRQKNLKIMEKIIFQQQEIKLNHRLDKIDFNSIETMLDTLNKKRQKLKNRLDELEKDKINIANAIKKK